MSLNFGGGMFRDSGRIINSFDFADLLRGNTYIEFFGGKLNIEETEDESYEEATVAYYLMDNQADTEWGAQSFEIGFESGNAEFFIEKISAKIVYVDAMGEDDSNIKIHLYKLDVDGKPTGTPLYSSAAITISHGDSYREYTLTTPLRVLAGAKYAIVIESIIDNFDPQYVGWDYGETSLYTGGEYMTSADAGSTWTKDATKSFLFKVTGKVRSPYTLFTNRFDSDPEQEAGEQDIQFDVAINKSSIIEGDALLNVNTSGQTDIKTRLYRVRNEVETLMGTSTTSLDTTRKAITIQITKTTLRKGDVLRLRISSATGVFTIDYSDNDSAAEKNLRMWIPFKSGEITV